MSLTATFSNATASIAVAVTGAPSNASTVLIERSTDQATWTTVRGTTPPVSLSGGAYSVTDYEFTDGVINYYRATYYDTSAPVAVGTPAAATVVTSAGASATVTPTMPTGLAVGDVVFVFIANTKATAVLGAAPAGWTLLATDADGLGCYCADWTASLTIPAFSVSGLASGDKVIGKATAMRNVSTNVGNVNSQVNAASTNIVFPAFIQATGVAGGPLVMFSRTINTGTTPAVTTNDTATGWTLLTWDLVPATYGSGTITLSGSSSATSSVMQVTVLPRLFVSQETGNTTPALTQPWVKNPIKPYLNRAISVVDLADVVHKSRSATFDIIGRTMPVAVTDLMSGRNTTVTLRATTRATTDDLESCIIPGEVLFFHAPKGAVAPTGYFVPGDTTRHRIAAHATARNLLVPLTEVAAPSPVLAAVLSTWQTVISTYATWQALINAKATWADVLTLVGIPSDVITG